MALLNLSYHLAERAAKVTIVKLPGALIIILAVLNIFIHLMAELNLTTDYKCSRLSQTKKLFLITIRNHQPYHQLTFSIMTVKHTLLRATLSL